MVGLAGEALVTGGRARRTIYAARRAVEGVPAAVPVWDLGARPPRVHARLSPVAPRGYVTDDGVWYQDLPWFLFEVRPSGFLGRLTARAHPEVGGDDPRLWTSDQVLRWAVAHGGDEPGAFVLGDDGWRRWMAGLADPPPITPRTDYPALAVATLAHGHSGSSAGGEQPKFLVNGPDGPALVKFSARVVDAPSRRVADLLIAEHLALMAARDAGHDAARSLVYVADERVFLEVGRFDRDGAARRGVVSLLAAAANEGLALHGWGDAVAALEARGRATGAREARWREVFAAAIANPDTHFGNLSFYAEGQRLEGLAPIYDMLPMAYAPRGTEVVNPTFHPPLPAPDTLDVWPSAVAAATDTWARIAANEAVSAEFREIASANAERLRALAPLAAPWGALQPTRSRGSSR